jgi:hypothetical protein
MPHATTLTAGRNPATSNSHLSTTRTALAPARTPHWVPWPDRTWPTGPHEEADFVARLHVCATSGAVEHQRSDITAVLDALRCGRTVDDLLGSEPGLVPGRLLSAYVFLEAHRTASARAWYSIVNGQNIASLQTHGMSAARLLPGLVGRLLSETAINPADLGKSIYQLAADVELTGRRVRQLEHRLEACHPPSARGVELSRLLYDPSSRGATCRPDYLPTRVAALDPARVAALLGESGDITIHPATDEVTPRW